MSPPFEIDFSPVQAKKLHVVRVFNAACDKPKYHLCVEVDDGGGRFILVSTGYPTDRQRPNRAILDSRLLALPVPKKSKHSEFDLSKTFRLSSEEIRSGIDFGPIGENAGLALAQAFNTRELRRLHGDDGWRLLHETFITAYAKDPNDRDRRYLDGDKLRRRLNNHDSCSATLRASARTAPVREDHACAGAAPGFGTAMG